MARKATRLTNKTTARKTTTRRKRDSRLFAVKLSGVPLDKEQTQRIASKIRDVTTKELLRMDFLIEHLAVPPRGKITAQGCNGCG